MAAPVKVWVGNYDGVRRGMVRATSQRAAALATHTSAGRFREFWGLVHDASHAIGFEALADRVLYTQPCDAPPDVRSWWFVGSCPLPKRRPSGAWDWQAWREAWHDKAVKLLEPASEAFPTWECQLTVPAARGDGWVTEFDLPAVRARDVADAARLFSHDERYATATKVVIWRST